MSRLNLLPDEIRAEILLSKRNAHLRQYVFFMIATTVTLLAVFGVLLFYLNIQKNEAKETAFLAQKQIEINEEDFLKAKDMDKRIALIRTINQADYDWIKILKELGSRTPSNLQISSFTSQKIDKNRIKITGISQNDKNVVTLKENLSQSELLAYVDIESISKSVNSQGEEQKVFVISFSLKPEKVKNEK